MEGSLSPLQSMCQLQLRRMMCKAFGEICQELSGTEALEEVDKYSTTRFCFRGSRFKEKYRPSKCSVEQNSRPGEWLVE
jgi:hypothetical protein